MNPAREFAKGILGDLPLTAEAYWLLRSRRNIGRFSLERLSARLPEMVSQVTPYAAAAENGKKVFFFASSHIWIQHAVATSLALAGFGHQVTFAYLPYADWRKVINRFDLRRTDIYARSVLDKARPLLAPVALLHVEPKKTLPEALRQSIEKVCIYDTQYTLQKEEVRGDEPIYQLRMERNLAAAGRAMTILQKHRPDVVIIPNGMIQEYGAVYETARTLGIPTVTYEFGEQDQRVWLGQNQLVMFHLTDDLWQARKDRRLNHEQRAWLETFLAARRGLNTGEGFAHLWQKSTPEGGVKIRSALKLDSRPIVLLPTNVMGDSATLGRTLFSRSIAEWVRRVVDYFTGHPEVQLVIRVHPAESQSVGPSLMEVIRQAVPELPKHIHVIGPTEKINTYDLMDVADLALVFTTTAGLEIAVRGIPVVVSGGAHYRDRGFTVDADSWDEYFRKLDRLLEHLPGKRLTRSQIERAWNYAYAYFREYPRPFPWHVEHLWRALEKRPLDYVLGETGREHYRATFQQMTGEPMDWRE